MPANLTRTCVEGCNKTVDPSNLSKHSKHCQIAINFKQKVNQERKARGLKSLLPPKAALGSALRKERLQTQVAKLGAKNEKSVPLESSSTSTLLESLLPAAVGPALEADIEMSSELERSSSQANEGDNPITDEQQRSSSGRPRREVRLPLRFQDYLPESATSFIDDDEPAPVRRVLLIVRDRLRTALNSFGIWREYPNRPSADPDSQLSLADMVNCSNKVTVTAGADPSFWPFENFTVHAMMKWLNNGHVTKSEAEVTKLVREVILAPGFRVHHLLGFDAHRENQRLDREISQSKLHSQFTECPLRVDVPSGRPGEKAVSFSVPGFLYRNIVTVIKEAFTGPLAHLLHYSPFRLYHRDPATGQDERVYGEIYTSNAFLEESDKVRYKSPPDPDDPTCNREKVVAALMFSSDATHLTEFGNATAWPIYLMLGNLSKYIRSQPDSGAIHHLAYIPSLPGSFKEFVEAFHPKWRSQKAQILTHCRRELMQEVWKTLLDDEFLHAYKFGIVVECIDGIERRIFPRLFTYSADYPEKVLLATIRDKGTCPCPRCLVQSKNLDQLGTCEDTDIRSEYRTYNAKKVQRARNFIYNKAKPITGTNVEALLKEHSFVPTKNAFIDRLGPDFDPFRMLVVDLLHEFELGVWKTLFSHLIRILYAAVDRSDKHVIELDRRFAAISTFGRGTIRKFPSNSSEMKKMAARDFEDILQCSIPVFEGLLQEPHNQRLMTLLYRTAEWHALAKLRMQTDESLRTLQDITTDLGTLLRDFRDATCAEFETVELPKEAAARARRKAASTSEQLSTGSGSSPNRRPRTLNLQTVKMHFLGDYVDCIRLFGTSDSFSTQLGELQHRIIKQLYALTNKKEAMPQVGKKYSRHQAFQDDECQEEQEIGTRANLADRFSISESRHMPISLFELVGQNTAASVKNFIPKLQEHILLRLTSRSGSFTEQERDSIRIRNNTIYEHLTARINYTTYDLRRDYDVVNSRSRPYIMTLDPECEQHTSFWYASVLGIFHVEFQHVGATSKNLHPQTLQFFWVRWLEPVDGHDFGRHQARLPKLRFASDDDEFAYGCLDPSLVLRGCHMIPAFHDGPKIPSTSGSPETQQVKYHGRDLMIEESLNKWKNYYVGIFVDRDMFMRHLGLGLGHKGRQQDSKSYPERGAGPQAMEGIEPVRTEERQEAPATDTMCMDDQGLYEQGEEMEGKQCEYGDEDEDDDEDDDDPDGSEVDNAESTGYATSSDDGSADSDVDDFAQFFSVDKENCALKTLLRIEKFCAQRFSLPNLLATLGALTPGPSSNATSGDQIISDFGKAPTNIICTTCVKGSHDLMQSTLLPTERLLG
ncbi:hypothetical protein BJ165DRAFT_1611041 [Panaeolus papilionaceus]|nr:hypothetical protein BJ165DRAFT_1611041 [Panaeolus papilionaceus]